MASSDNTHPRPNRRLDNISAQLEKADRLTDAHPLTRSSREYADVTRGLLGALRPTVEAGGDAVLLAAIDTIDRLADLIAVKTRRAVRGLTRDDDDLADREPIQNDAHGCAKLVRLIVAESRDAWTVLRLAGRADGLPALMVRRLDHLEAAVARAFPLAMDSVRPRLDESGD